MLLSISMYIKLNRLPPHHHNYAYVLHTLLWLTGFTPDVKVWEVLFDKSRSYKGVKRAFELKGHKAGVLTLAFSSDSTRMVTVSKDSTWKLWKTDGK